jgi:cation transport regulator ChaC
VLNANVFAIIISLRLISRLRVSDRSRRAIREVRSTPRDGDDYTSHARDARVRIKRACKNVLLCLYYTFVMRQRAFVRDTRRKQIAGLAAAFLGARSFVREGTCERYAGVTHEAPA